MTDPLQIRDRLFQFRDLRLLLLLIIADRVNPPIILYYRPDSSARTRGPCLIAGFMTMIEYC